MPSSFVEIELFAVVVVLSIGLFVFLARQRLRSLQEIQSSADNHSATFSVEQECCDRATFDLKGKTLNGVPWKLSTGTPGDHSGCALRLDLTFPTLGGDSDLVVVPRDERWESVLTIPTLLDAIEFPSGAADFDASYKVLVAPRQLPTQPLNPALAKRFVKWPKNAVAPNPMAAWRDQSGFHVEAHLSKMNWATVEHLLILGEGISERLPAASV
jgi:hypothetical protein